MDRPIVYAGEAPLSTDFLFAQRATMTAIGNLLQTVLGTGTYITGLGVTQTAVPSMSVLVAPGNITQLTTVDNSSYGGLAADTTDALMKMGINLAATTLGPFTAPVTNGQSVNILIQATFAETDSGSTVLTYFNAANPAAPFSGPANSGTPQNTRRLQTVGLQAVVGTPAATGSQTTPAVSGGYVGVAVITIAYGASSIVNANINPYPQAPFLPVTLPNLRYRLAGNTSYYVSSGGSDTTGNGTAAAPWATPQKAVNWIYANVDSANYKVTINVADGTYPPVAVSGPLPGGGALYLVGDVAAPQNCIISSSTNYTACLQVNLFALVYFGGFKFVNSAAASGFGVQAWQSGKAYMNGNCQFGACNGGHIIAQDAGSTVAITASYSINGNAPYHYASFYGALIATGGPTLSVTVTLTGTPAFSTEFAGAWDNGVILCNSGSATFSGSATGTRYNAFLGGIIDTGGSGATYFPGSVAGTATSPGAYA